MNLHSKMKIFILLTLGVIFVISSITIVNNNLCIKTESNPSSNINNENLKVSKNFEKIHIDNNWSDTKSAGICTGSGKESSPYVIENLEIDGGASGSCILIENSDEYFKIENCYFNNTGDEYYDAGVKLIDVDNGQLINNNVTGDAFGFFLNRSDNNIIMGNRLTGKRGLYLGICYGTIMYLNNLMGKQMDLFILIKDETAYRFHSPKKATYIYKGNTFDKYLGNYWAGLSQNTDNNNDGIGDDPQIYYDSYELLIDRYPLVEPFENYEIIKFSEDSKSMIPGYDLFLLIGIISTISVFMLFKLKKLHKINS
ncbi:MAG: hypothetical protein ACFFB0_06030 [Promethearchaeota archaeon]